MSTCHHFGPTAPAHGFCRSRRTSVYGKSPAKRPGTGISCPAYLRTVADDLADILASPHPSHPYDTLKAAIISRKSEYEHSRLQQVITGSVLGDRCPSQLLRRTRQLLGRRHSLVDFF
ncbi:hypothetical protein HPB51_021686 [Rhipicephalus microplus]|uniref:Tick transposon n=1 Tax=Rhipicephalus microplus TaxID=6941 RepID=A0A9J6D750_RHIMP|nr:hypothetical protein HPB51_021686 [Rhipicephalus microplus]